VSQAVHSGTFDDFPDSHPRAFLSHAPGADFAGGSHWHATVGHGHRRLWIVDATIGCGWALAVESYPPAWFLENDQVKLAAYRILDSHRLLSIRYHAERFRECLFSDGDGTKASVARCNGDRIV
jgi:hypothetical protein